MRFSLRDTLYVATILALLVFLYIERIRSMEIAVWEHRVKYLTETLREEGYEVSWSTGLREVEIRRADPMFHSFSQFKKDP